MPKIFPKFERGHPQRGRQMEVGYGKVGEFLPVNNLPARTHYCRVARSDIGLLRSTVCVEARLIKGCMGQPPRLRLAVEPVI